MFSGAVPIRSQLIKYLIMMKLIVAIFLLTIVQVNAESYAQTITLSRKNVSIENIFKEIKKQTHYRLICNTSIIKETPNMDVDVEELSLHEFLDQLAKEHDLSYVIENKTIVIKRSPLRNKILTPPVQQQEITGNVTDKQGVPLQGVTVTLKNTQTVTTTNAEGQYSIPVPQENSVLVYTIVGFMPVERIVGSNESINVTLEALISDLDEVVVVGYGTQKRSNLTGSVETLDATDIENQTVTQASQVLSGTVSGVTVIQNSGQPGNDQGRILIRGMGTFSSAGNSPLVLVDGLAASMNDVNPSDIKSISVLKDASSASIYGARAANGVILIETKQGETGKMKVSYNGYMGYQRPTSLVQLVNSWEYAEFMNEASLNEGRSRVYTDEEIAKFKSGEDPDNYPNANHYEDLLTSGSGFQTNHDVSFSGGTNTHSYLFSLGYLNQDGLIKETSYDRYNLRLNLNSKLSDKLNLKVRLSGKQGQQNQPVSAGSNGQKNINGLITYAIKIANTIPARKSDGTYGSSSGFTTAGWLDSESFNNDKSNNFLGSAELEYNILSSWKVSGKVGYLVDASVDKTYGAELIVDQFYTEGPAQLTVRNNNSSLMTLQLLTDYNLSLSDHSIHLLAGYSQEAAKSNWISAFRDNFTNNSLYEINAGSQSNMQNGGSGTEWALKSLFGRVNYSYQDKYLFEANLRYDGSSRFPKKNRYGIFPSFSAGWTLSNEGFLQDKFDWLDLLKLRASYGQLGNQEIGLYPYQTVLSTGRDYPFGISEVFTPGVSATVIPNSEITWETTEISNVGVDMDLWKGKFSLRAEYFYKKTSDILYNVSSSYVLGLASSEQNAGMVENKGWEFNLQHRNSLGEFSYNVSLNLSKVNNKVLKLANIERDLDNGLIVGFPLQAMYGYEVDGLFVDNADIENYPKQPYAAFPGEYRFRDLNGPDGRPDGIVDPDHDRKVIGSRLPKYSYGLNINTGYKGWDLSMQFRGLGGFQRTLGGEQGRGLLLGSNVQEWMFNNRWTPENPDPSAIYPRALVLNAGSVHNWTSTYWLRDASFLRLSNLQLGYTLPQSLLKGVGRIRAYVSARNLLSFDNYYPGWDPESGNNYPPSTVYTFGFNVNL